MIARGTTGASRLGRFTIALAYALALLLSLAVSGVLPGFPPAYLQPSSIFVLRIVAAGVLLFVAVGEEFLSGDFKDRRDTEVWHAGLVFSLVFLISWLVFIDVSGDGFHQPANPDGPYTVPVYLFRSTRYFTPFQAEIREVARWMSLVGLLGRAVVHYRRNARLRRRV
jgi:hypothetical protein